MASKVVASDLKIAIRETISLNGAERGSYITKTISSIGEIDRRIMSITDNTHGTNILDISTTAGAGQHAKGKVKYLRITNLDTQYYVTIMFTNGDGQGSGDHFWQIKLDAGKSVVLGDVENIDAASDIDSVSFTSIARILGKAQASSDEVDIEVFIAAT
jgi:hypothetical protein